MRGTAVAYTYGARKTSKRRYENMKMIGIKTGETKNYKAGLNRLEVTMSAEDGGVVINGQKIESQPDRLAVWHKGDTETFWGAYTLESLKVADKARGAKRVAPIYLAESHSGDGQGVAAVYPLPCAILTSRLKGRGDWRLRILHADGTEESCTPAEYRARHRAAI